MGSKLAVIDPETCTGCALCEEKCRFDAAHPPEIDPFACEGCAVCEFVCPVKAIRMVDRVSGQIYTSDTRYGPMVHARLNAGEGNSGKLVTEVRKRASQIAKTQDIPIVLIDGSPGVGCPVIATVTGVSLGIVVTEPTESGVHDMRRVVALLDQFRVKPAVIINKYDLNPENSQEIEKFCNREDIPVLGRIPFDPVMTQSMVAARTLPEYAELHPITKMLSDIWNKISGIVQESKKEG